MRGKMRGAGLAIIFMLVYFTSGAQPVRGKKVEVQGSLQCTQRSEQAAARAGCRLIYELAVPRAKDPWKSFISYRFSVEVNLHDSDESVAGISGTVTVSDVGDLKMYEGFDLGAFILPSAAVLRLVSDGNVYKSDIHFADSTAFFRLAGSFSSMPAFLIDSLQYDSGRFDGFYQSLSAVRDYKAFSAVAQTFTAQAAERYADPWQEIAALLWFHHAGQAAQSLSVWTTKGLAGQDPAEMADLARSVGVEAYRRQLAFAREKRMASLAGVPFSAESTAWLGNQIESVLNHPESRNPYSTAFLNRLAVLGTAPSGEGTESSLSVLWPDGEHSGEPELVIPFLKAVIADLHQRAAHCVALEKYQEALVYAGNAAFLAHQTNDAQLLARSEQAISQAHHGILDAWLTIAQRALQADNIPLSQQYLQKATDYRAAQHEAIVSEEALNATLELFTDSCLQKATRQVARGDYSEAIKQLDVASAYLSKLPFYSRQSQFDFIFNQACTRYYENQLNQAVEWLDGADRPRGRTLLSKAVKFRLERPNRVTQREEEKIGMKMVGLFDADSILVRAAILDTNDLQAIYPLIDRAASMLDTLYPVNADTVRLKFGSLAAAQLNRSMALFEQDVAIDSYQTAEDRWVELRPRFQRYGAVADSMFLPALNSIEKKGLKTACRLHGNWGKALTDACYDAAMAKEFQQALGLIVDARRVYRDNPACGHDTALLDQIGRRYREVWLFMGEIARVDTLLSQQKVAEAVAWFDLNRTNYDRNFMKLADMPAPRLETYLSRYPLPELIAVVMERMFYKTPTNNLIALFETLRLQSVSPDQLDPWLSELGNVMATDYRNAGANPRSDSYLQVFKADRKWYAVASARFINNVADNWFERNWLKLKLMI